MSLLQEMEIRLFANVARLATDMAEVKRTVGATMKDIQDATDLAKKAFVGLTGVASVGAFVGLVKGAIDAAEALHDLSIQTGVSVETLSAFTELGKKTDTSAQDIAGAMNKLAKNMAVANEESKGTGAAIKALGLDFNAFRQMSPDDQMVAVAKAMNQFEDGAGKSAVAMTLFGKEGARLLPFFADLATAGKLNATLTKEQADMADEYNDRLTELKGVGERWVRTIAIEALPALSKLAEFNEGLVKITGVYLGLVWGVPKAVGAATVALKEMAAAKAAAAAAGTGLSASLTAIITKVGVLGLAVNTLFAAFAGWEIGKWLRENFLEAQLAGIAFVDGTLVGWQRIKYGAEVAWAWIKAAAFETLDVIIARFAETASAAGRGFVAMGKADIGLPLLAFAEHAAAAAKSSFDFGAEMKRLDAELASNIKTVKAITDDMADYAIQSFATTKAVSKHKEQMKFQSDEVRKAAKAEAAAHEQLTDVVEVEITVLKALKDAHEKELTAATKGVEGIRDQIARQREANDAMRYSVDELAHLEIQKIRDAAATADRNALLADETLINGDIAEQYRQQAAGLRELAGLKEDGIHLQAAQEAAAEWQKTSDSIFNSLSDALLRAFESGKGFGRAFVDTLKNMFQTMVMQPIVQSLLTPIAGALGSLLGGPAAAGTGGGAGVGGIAGMVSALKNVFSSNSVTSWGAGLLGGYMGGKLISGQYGSSKTVIGGTALGAAVGGPLGALVGGMVGGVVNRLFGRGPKQITEKGIVGDVVGGEFDGQLYADWKRKGGLLRSSKRGTDYSPVDEELAQTMDAAGAAVFSEVSDYAEILGLPADVLAKVNYKLKVRLTDDEAENQKLLEAAFTEYQEQLSKSFAEALKPFQEAGETASETLRRLSEVQVFSESLNEFGGVFARVAGLSLRAKEELIGFAGGIEAFVAKTQSFVENYYSDTEKFGIGARQVQEQLAALGITGDISSRADFRRLVEGTDISTTEGRRQLDALLTLAQTFAPIAQYLEQNGGSLADLAQQAPDTGVLQSVLDDQEILAEYQQRVANGVDNLNNSVLSIGERISAAIATGNADIIAALVAIAQSSLQTARQLDKWDDNGALVTTTGP